jgi:hypothetical protein
MLRHGIQYRGVPIIAIISNKASAVRGYVNDQRDHNESAMNTPRCTRNSIMDDEIQLYIDTARCIVSRTLRLYLVPRR